MEHFIAIVKRNQVKCEGTKEMESVMTPLTQFIEDQIAMRRMTEREFARFVGVSNSTISRARGDNPPEPSFEFVAKLSKATGHSLLSVLRLAFPEYDFSVDEQTIMLAERIIQLPPEERAQAETFVTGLAFKSGNK